MFLHQTTISAPVAAAMSAAKFLKKILHGLLNNDFMAPHLLHSNHAVFWDILHSVDYYLPKILSLTEAVLSMSFVLTLSAAHLHRFLHSNWYKTWGRFNINSPAVTFIQISKVWPSGVCRRFILIACPAAYKRSSCKVSDGHWLYTKKIAGSSSSHCTDIHVVGQSVCSVVIFWAAETRGWGNWCCEPANDLDYWTFVQR